MINFPPLFSANSVIAFFGRRSSNRGSCDKKTSLQKANHPQRQNLISLGDDFWIENGRGQKMYKVNGKVLNVRNTLDIEDRQGRCMVKIQAKVLSITQAMDIEDAQGRKMATVRKNLVNVLRDTWKVDSPVPGQDMKVTGNLLDHEYEITMQGRKVAEVSKRFLSLSDCYGIEILPNQNDALILATVICVDQMAHPDNKAADGGIVHGTTADLGVLTPGQGGGPINVNNANVALSGMGQAIVQPPAGIRPPMGAPPVAVMAGAAVVAGSMNQPQYAPPQMMQPGYAPPPMGYGQPQYQTPQQPGVPVGAMLAGAAVVGAMNQPQVPQYAPPPQMMGQPTQYAAPPQQQPGIGATVVKGAAVNAALGGKGGVGSALLTGAVLNAARK